MDNMKDGYYIAPAFMDKLVVHIAKNFMDLPNIKVTGVTRTYNLFDLYTQSSPHILTDFVVINAGSIDSWYLGWERTRKVLSV